MPIDPSIPLRALGQPTPLRDPLQTMQTFAEMQNRQRLTDIQEQEHQLAVQTAKQAAAAQQQTGEAYRSAWKQDPTTGEWDLDEAVLLRSVASTAYPQAMQYVQATKKSALEFRKLEEERNQKGVEALRNAADMLERTHFDPIVWKETLDGFKTIGLLTPAGYAEFSKITDPAEIERRVNTLRQAIPARKRELTNVPKGGTTIDDQTGRIVFQDNRKDPSEVVKFADEDVIATLPDGSRYVGKAGYNNELNAYAPAGSKTPFPEGTKVVRQPTPSQSGSGGADSGDVKTIVQGMIDGTLPPQLPGRASPAYNAIMAEAQRRGFDLSGAVTDWMATTKHVQTMNGAQQLRLNQAVNALPEMLDSVEALAHKWKGGRFPILNRANLALAKGGGLGPEAAKIANALDAQIADVVADLGNVYMGGNSPTDHALTLAAKSLSADWSEEVLLRMVALAKQNVQIRRNSINSTGVAGASADNPYAPAVPAPAAHAAPAAAAAPKEGDKKPIPGYPGTEQTYTNGRWIRTK